MSAERTWWICRLSPTPRPKNSSLRRAIVRVVALSRSDWHSPAWLRTVSLIHHDQLEVLRRLRASVEYEMKSLATEVAKFKADLSESEQRGTMLIDRINQLLMDKVGLQEISLEERSVQLEYERRFGEMRWTLEAKAWPLDATEALATARKQRESLEEQLKALAKKRDKARQFVHLQDQMIQGLRAEKSKPFFDPAELPRARDHIKHLEYTVATSNQLLTAQLHSDSHPCQTTGTPLRWGPSSSWLLSQRQIANPASNPMATVPKVPLVPPQHVWSI